MYQEHMGRRRRQESKKATREDKKRRISIDQTELRLLIAVASGRRDSSNDGGIVVVGRRTGTVVLQPQPGRFHGRGRRVEVGHLALQHGAVGGEGAGSDVEVEGDAEEEVHLQVVHFHQADTTHAREVGVVVASASHKQSANQQTELCSSHVEQITMHKHTVYLLS
jgi:hypothetical protein